MASKSTGLAIWKHWKTLRPLAERQQDFSDKMMTLKKAAVGDLAPSLSFMELETNSLHLTSLTIYLGRDRWHEVLSGVLNASLPKLKSLCLSVERSGDEGEITAEALREYWPTLFARFGPRLRKLKVDMFDIDFSADLIGPICINCPLLARFEIRSFSGAEEAPSPPLFVYKPLKAIATLRSVSFQLDHIPLWDALWKSEERPLELWPDFCVLLENYSPFGLNVELHVPSLGAEVSLLLASIVRFGVRELRDVLGSADAKLSLESIYRDKTFANITNIAKFLPEVWRYLFELGFDLFRTPPRFRREYDASPPFGTFLTLLFHLFPHKELFDMIFIEKIVPDTEGHPSQRSMLTPFEFSRRQHPEYLARISESIYFAACSAQNSLFGDAADSLFHFLDVERESLISTIPGLTKEIVGDQMLTDYLGVPPVGHASRGRIFTQLLDLPYNIHAFHAIFSMKYRHRRFSKKKLVRFTQRYGVEPLRAHYDMGDGCLTLADRTISSISRSYIWPLNRREIIVRESWEALEYLVEEQCGFTILPHALAVALVRETSEGNPFGNSVAKKVFDSLSESVKLRVVRRSAQFSRDLIGKCFLRC